MMTKPHEQGNTYAFLQGLSGVTMEKPKTWNRVLNLLSPLLQTHGVSQLFKTVFMFRVNLTVLQ